jgi:outer membrane protein insertion porin family
MHDLPQAATLRRFIRSLLLFLLAVATGGCAGAGRPPAWSQSTPVRQAPTNSVAARPPVSSTTRSKPPSDQRDKRGDENRALASASQADDTTSSPNEEEPERAPLVVRGQSPEYASGPANQPTPGSNEHWRYGIPAAAPSASRVQPAQYQYGPPQSGYAPLDTSPYATSPYAPPGSLLPASPASQPTAGQPGMGFAPPPVPNQPGGFILPQAPPSQLPSVFGPDANQMPGVDQLPEASTVPWDVIVEEARTGQFMIGVGVNSDAGVTGQVILDERNFDWTRVPTSLDDIVNGTAFRGAGQGFRMEAVPGTLVQRYLVSFTEPYLFDTQVSLNVSGFYFDRRYFDWDEQRLGGRLALGYRLTPDLSFTTALRMENVLIHRPRVRGVQELEEVLGNNALYSPRFSLTHDTRDVPFLPTEGHFFEISYEQVFGTFHYPRGEVDYRKYFLVTERPDGSGRHTLSYNMRVGISGSQTPVFENFFAGGFSTLRGFDFRGASPVNGNVRVGGEFRFLGSLEYMFPLTADDMIRGVVFCDFGTVEERVEVEWDDFRVAPGLGLRISIPALGPAPIALDFAVPIMREDTDEIENFSFFFGFGRS